MGLIADIANRTRRVASALADLSRGPAPLASADGLAGPAGDVLASTAPAGTGARASADWGGSFLPAAQLRNRLRGTAAAQDPRRQNTWEERVPYDAGRAESIARNGVARRAVSMRWEDAMRPGWTISYPDIKEKGQAKEVAAKVDAYHRRLKTKQKFKLAGVWSEVHGHSIVVVGADDGQANLAEPLREDEIRSIRWLKVFKAPRYMIGDLSDGATPEADGTVREPGLPLWFEVQDLGEPEVEAYRVSAGARATAPTRVHWTRVLGPFHTQDGHSRLDEYGEALEDFFSTHDAAERFAATMSVGHFQIDGWNQRCAQDEENARGRVDAAAAGMSALNCLITDRSEESFGYEGRPATGLDGILDRKQVLLCGTTGLPMMKLFGQDPAGFSSGAEVVDDYNTGVHVVFEDQAEPELRRLTRMVHKAADGPGLRPAPEVFVITMLPLRLPSPKDLTEMRATTWRAVHDITGEPLLDRREARESLFGSGASEATPTIQLAPEDARQETPPAIEVGVAQAIVAVVQASLAGGTPDQWRAALRMVNPQAPDELLLRVIPDAPEPMPGEAADPTDAQALAAEPEQWKTAEEIAAAFGSVTAAQIKAHRCPTKGAAVEEDDPRAPGTPGLRWIKPGAKPLYRLSEVRAKLEGGGPDLDPATGDMAPPADEPAVPGVPAAAGRA